MPSTLIARCRSVHPAIADLAFTAATVGTSQSRDCRLGCKRRKGVWESTTKTTTERKELHTNSENHGANTSVADVEQEEQSKSGPTFDAAFSC
jgi:hypothetical protein